MWAVIPCAQDILFLWALLHGKCPRSLSCSLLYRNALCYMYLIIMTQAYSLTWCNNPSPCCVGISATLGVNKPSQDPLALFLNENTPTLMHLLPCAFHSPFAQLTSFGDATCHDDVIPWRHMTLWRHLTGQDFIWGHSNQKTLESHFLFLWPWHLTNWQTHRQTNGTGSITSTADAEGNNIYLLGVVSFRSSVWAVFTGDLSLSLSCLSERKPKKTICSSLVYK